MRWAEIGAPEADAPEVVDVAQHAVVDECRQFHDLGSGIRQSIGRAQHGGADLGGDGHARARVDVHGDAPTPNVGVEVVPLDVGIRGIHRGESPGAYPAVSAAPVISRAGVMVGCAVIASPARKRHPPRERRQYGLPMSEADEGEARPPRSGLLWFALVLGSALLAGGVMAVFLTSNEGGSAAILWAGALLVGLSLIGDRIDGFETAGVKVRLKASANRALQQAEQAEAEGDLERASELRTRAEALLSTARDVSSRYEEVRNSQTYGGERNAEMERIVREARALAYRPEATRSGLDLLFNTGNPGNRVTALAIMDERPHLASPDLLRDALTSPRSAFEMYTALSAARSYLASGLPTEAEQSSIVTVVKSQLEGRRLGARNSDRVAVANKILQRFPLAS